VQTALLFTLFFFYLPSCEEAWLQVAKDFNKWNIPHCLGATDEKHVVLQCPANN
jgi:hypothetical protein